MIIKEQWIEKENVRLFGRLYLPSAEGPYRLVIISHGFESNYQDNENYAQVFAENGIAAYVYDFRGGSSFSKSGGDSKQMSVMTELDELAMVLQYFQGRLDIRQDHIFLLGESQGGLVSALGAAKWPGDIAGLMMLYPAFCIPDNGRSSYATLDDIPAVMDFWGMPVGKNYYADVWNMDVYKIIPAYKGPVLIFHGTVDDLVDLSYSTRAVDVYAQARLEIVAGEGHGFYGHAADKPALQMVDFVNEQSKENDFNKQNMQDCKFTKLYRVKTIEEPDFGCEGRPDGYEPEDTVVLVDDEGAESKMKVKDDQLYRKEIDEGDTVRVIAGELFKV